MSVRPHEWQAALLCCVSVVAPVNRKPMKRKKKQIAQHSTNSAGCKILNNDLGKCIWENSVGSTGETKAKAQDVLLYRDVQLHSESPALSGLHPGEGTRRDMEGAEAPMGAAEATGEFATGNESKGTEEGGGCEENLH